MLVHVIIDNDILPDCFGHLAKGKSKEELVEMYFHYNEMIAVQYDGPADKGDIKDWLLESSDDELSYFKQLIDTEIAEREAEDLANATNYVFALNVGGQIVDTTNLDENNPEHAMGLFLDEFGWSKKIPFHQKGAAFVELIEEQRG